MPRRVLLVPIALAIAVAAPAARAEGGNFGLGLIFGSPTGISAKYYLGDRSAIDGALGVAFLGKDGIHIHADYLWHPIMLAEDDAFFLPLYVGIGARLLIHDRGGRNDDELRLGPRIPVGIVFDFRTIPLDVFLEAALIVDLIQDYDDPDDDILDVNFGLGARYYF